MTKAKLFGSQNLDDAVLVKAPAAFYTMLHSFYCSQGYVKEDEMPSDSINSLAVDRFYQHLKQTPWQPQDENGELLINELDLEILHGAGILDLNSDGLTASQKLTLNLYLYERNNKALDCLPTGLNNIKYAIDVAVHKNQLNISEEGDLIGGSWQQLHALFYMLRYSQTSLADQDLQLQNSGHQNTILSMALWQLTDDIANDPRGLVQHGETLAVLEQMSGNDRYIDWFSNLTQYSDRQYGAVSPRVFWILGSIKGNGKDSAIVQQYVVEKVHELEDAARQNGDASSLDNKALFCGNFHVMMNTDEPFKEKLYGLRRANLAVVNDQATER